MIYAYKPEGSSGPIKIGCSSQPLSRLTVAESWSPVRLEMLFSVDGGFSHEKLIHHMFRKHRLHGEWFAPHREVLAFVDYVVQRDRLPDLPHIEASDVFCGADAERFLTISQMRGSGMTLQSIGDHYGVTRERVRQILAGRGAEMLAQRAANLASRSNRAAGIEARAEAIGRGMSAICISAKVPHPSWQRWKKGRGVLSERSLAKLEECLSHLEQSLSENPQ